MPEVAKKKVSAWIRASFCQDCVVKVPSNATRRDLPADVVAPATCKLCGDDRRLVSFEIADEDYRVAIDARLAEHNAAKKKVS